jgi:glycosyltransferase involved in cell wall biosynthesis
MLILYHHRTQAEDAQGVHIYEMVQAFRELGHQVEIMALVELDEATGKKVRGGRWGRLTRWAPTWLYETMGLAYNLYNYRRLCQTIRTRRPDLIYERYSLNTLCGIWASRRFHIPLILEVNAPLTYEQKKLGQLTFRRLARYSERWICSHSTRTIVVSQVMREHLIREGVPEHHIAVIPNGIDPQKFHPAVSGEGVRRRYGLDGNPVVGFVGWFRPWHGLEMLLEAFYQGQLAQQGIRLLLVGDGPAYPALARYVAHHHLEKSVIFTGPVKRQDVPAHIAAMDIAVQPSATEYACPMKIFEYMGMAKCVVAPNQSNIREILEDGRTGFLFRPGDAESLQATLREALTNPAEREARGSRSHQRIFERGYLWRANADKALSLALETAAEGFLAPAESRGHSVRPPHDPRSAPSPLGNRKAE